MAGTDAIGGVEPGNPLNTPTSLKQLD